MGHPVFLGAPGFSEGHTVFLRALGFVDSRKTMDGPTLCLHLVCLREAAAIELLSGWGGLPDERRRGSCSIATGLVLRPNRL